MTDGACILETSLPRDPARIANGETVLICPQTLSSPVRLGLMEDTNGRPSGYHGNARWLRCTTATPFVIAAE